MNVRTDKQMLLLNKTELLQYIRDIEKELHETNQALVELTHELQDTQESETTQKHKDIYKF